MLLPFCPEIALAYGSHEGISGDSQDAQGQDAGHDDIRPGHFFPI